MNSFAEFNRRSQISAYGNINDGVIEFIVTEIISSNNEELGSDNTSKLINL
jgi:hypothetical protein